MMPVPLLLADWFQAIGPLIGVVFWVVYQVLIAIREDKLAKENKRAERPLPEELEDGLPVREDQHEMQHAAPVEARADGQAEVRTEVEEFLRRLGQDPNEAVGAPAAPIKKPPLDPFEEPPVRRKPKRRRKPRQATGRVEVVVEDGSAAAPVVKTIKLQTSQTGRLNEERLSEHASHLGEEIAHADDRIEARLHEKFDHRLGKLSQRETRAEPSESTKKEKDQPSAAARLKEMLSTPGGVRDAIVLREIFSRPTDRW